MLTAARSCGGPTFRPVVVEVQLGQGVLFNAYIFDAEGTENLVQRHQPPPDARKLEPVDRVGEIYLTPELAYRWEGCPRRRRVILGSGRSRDGVVVVIGRHQ